MPKEKRDKARDERVLKVLTDLKNKRFKGNQAELARALKVTPTAVSDIFLDKRGAGVEMLVAIASLAGMSLEELVFGRSPRDALKTVREDRYAARAEARQRMWRIYERADEIISGDLYARAEDKNVDWWMRRIEEAQLEARRELEDPEGAERVRNTARTNAEQTAASDQAAMDAAEREDASLPRRARR